MGEDLRTSTRYVLQIKITGKWIQIQNEATLENARAALNLHMGFRKLKEYEYRIVKVTETREVVE